VIKSNKQLESTKDSLPVMVERAKIQEILLSRHKSLSDAFHLLSLAVAFGSLFFLIDLEELVLPEKAKCVPALWFAWSFAYLSCVAGSIHLWLDMMFSLRMHGLAEGMPETSEKWPENRIVDHIERRQATYGWHGVPCFLHTILLIGVFVSAAIYRFSNL
jgi:hypothetical protein